MFEDNMGMLFKQAIFKAKEKARKQQMKNIIVYEHTDGRLFRLRVLPSPDLKGYAEVTIYEMRGGYFYHPVDTRTFDVTKFDTIAAGAMSCLYDYLASTTKEDEIAKKWQEFENRG